VFVAIVERMPLNPDGALYLSCHRCKKVNKFRVTSPAELADQKLALAFLEVTATDFSPS
jgi:hypothetical protein